MKHTSRSPYSWMIFAFILITSACGTPQSGPTPQPSATVTTIPTDTSTPIAIPVPTNTPDLAATQRMDEFNAESQNYFQKGYLTTPYGNIIGFKDYSSEWAQIGSYKMLTLDHKATDFFMSAHFKWSSAYRNADVSGCGFVFGVQDNNDHYAVFLDRSRVFFVDADNSFGGARSIGATRGTGLVNFDSPAEADFTLIVKGLSAYVLVNKDLVGEYTLTQSRSLSGDIGLTVLSGTNQGYGTRCEMSHLHLWTPADD